MKKLLFAVFTLVLALTLVVPAYAHQGPPKPQQGGIDNDAFVGNLTLTVANTGVNQANGAMFGGGTVVTGPAVAYSGVLNQVNWTETTCNTCGREGGVRINNDAMVLNLTGTLANTGLNQANGGWVVGGGKVFTGGAAASSVVQNVVNTNVVSGPVFPGPSL